MLEWGCIMFDCIEAYYAVRYDNVDRFLQLLPSHLKYLH